MRWSLGEWLFGFVWFPHVLLGTAQVPTTLLAMVDASVGGKTAVNTRAGKNLVGAFHQPRLVWADLALLDTLPPRHFANGLAEAIKMAACLDAAFFNELEAASSRGELGQALGVGPAGRAAKKAITTVVLPSQHEEGDHQRPQHHHQQQQQQQQQEQLQQQRPARQRRRQRRHRHCDPQLLLRIVQRSVELKAEVVEQDERERGLRAVLNWGHTIGHGVESLMEPRLLHGECVAIGCVKEAEVSQFGRSVGTNTNVHTYIHIIIPYVYVWANK